MRALESKFKQVSLAAQPDSEEAGKMVASAVSNMDVGLGAMKAMDDEDESDQKKNQKGAKKVKESSSSGNGAKVSVRTPAKTKAKAVEWSGLMQELTKEAMDCQRRLKKETDDGSLKVEEEEEHHEAQEVFASLLPPRRDIVVRATGPAVPADLGFVGLEARDGRGGPSGTDHAERALVNREQEEALAWTYFETCGETKTTEESPAKESDTRGKTVLAFCRYLRMLSTHECSLSSKRKLMSWPERFESCGNFSGLATGTTFGDSSGGC